MPKCTWPIRLCRSTDTGDDDQLGSHADHVVDGGEVHLVDPTVPIHRHRRRRPAPPASTTTWLTVAKCTWSIRPRRSTGTGDDDQLGSHADHVVDGGEVHLVDPTVTIYRHRRRRPTRQPRRPRG
jgi:hypothetical protein